MNPLVRWVKKIIQFFRPASAPAGESAPAPAPEKPKSTAANIPEAIRQNLQASPAVKPAEEKPQPAKPEPRSEPEIRKSEPEPAKAILAAEPAPESKREPIAPALTEKPKPEASGPMAENKSAPKVSEPVPEAAPKKSQLASVIEKMSAPASVTIETKPELPASTPVVEKKPEPVAEKPAPVVAKSEPVPQKPEPVPAEKKTPEPTPAPVVTAPKPSAPEAKVETSVPVTEKKPEPLIEKPTPVLAKTETPAHQKQAEPNPEPSKKPEPVPAGKSPEPAPAPVITEPKPSLPESKIEPVAPVVEKKSEPAAEKPASLAPKETPALTAKDESPTPQKTAEPTPKEEPLPQGDEKPGLETPAPVAVESKPLPEPTQVEPPRAIAPEPAPIAEKKPEPVAENEAPAAPKADAPEARPPVEKTSPAPAPAERKPVFTGQVEYTEAVREALDKPYRLRHLEGMLSVHEIANRELLDLVPYEPGKPVDDVARELGLDPASIIKLASNENPLGPSPLAQAAMRDAIDKVHFYPDGGGFHLRNAIANAFGLGRANVVLGNGSNEIIELLFHTFTRPGIHEIVTSRHAFAVYTLMAQLFGVHAIEVDDVDFTPDLPAMLKAITPQTRLVFLASPNNPTGTRVSNEALEQFLRDVPAHVIVVLDEAYYEFLDNPPDTVGHVKAGDRIVLMRTFSKIQGLAGLRIGYGLAPAELADLLQRARQPFNANAIAQAGAMAGLADVEHQRKTKAITDEGRKLIEEAFGKMGLKYVPSAANFVLVNVGDGGEVFKRLMKKGIIVRSMVSYHLPQYIRVSIGTPEQNQRFLAELPAALEGLVEFTK